MSDTAKTTDAPCPRSPLRPLQFAVDCPACERTMLLEACEWEQEPSGAYAAHGPERWPVCEYCDAQFEVQAVQVVPIGENSPTPLDAELAADPAIAASLAEWERTSGPPPGDFSPAAPFTEAEKARFREIGLRLDLKAAARLLTEHGYTVTPPEAPHG